MRDHELAVFVNEGRRPMARSLIPRSGGCRKDRNPLAVLSTRGPTGELATSLDLADAYSTRTYAPEELAVAIPSVEARRPLPLRCDLARVRSHGSKSVARA